MDVVGGTSTFFSIAYRGCFVWEVSNCVSFETHSSHLPLPAAHPGGTKPGTGYSPLPKPEYFRFFTGRCPTTRRGTAPGPRWGSAQTPGLQVLCTDVPFSVTSAVNTGTYSGIHHVHVSMYVCRCVTVWKVDSFAYSLQIRLPY